MPLSYDYNITILYYHIDIHIIAPQNKEKDNLGRNLMTEEKKTNQQEIWQQLIGLQQLSPIRIRMV